MKILADCNNTEFKLISILNQIYIKNVLSLI